MSVVLLVCMIVYVLYVCLMPKEARRHWIRWNWS